MEQKKEKFYTGHGDRGLTALTPGAQVSKADERIVAPGEVEELVAVLGTVKVVTPCPSTCAGSGTTQNEASNGKNRSKENSSPRFETFSCGVLNQ